MKERAEQPAAAGWQCSYNTAWCSPKDPSATTAVSDESRADVTIHWTHLLNGFAEVKELEIEVDQLSVLRQPVLRQDPVPKHAIYSEDGLLSVLLVLHWDEHM